MMKKLMIELVLHLIKKIHNPYKTLIVGYTPLFIIMFLISLKTNGNQYHVSPSGDDANTGIRSMPFKTISRAALEAYAGDTIIVYEGVYRERIDPPRGGTSDSTRIVYKAAEGEKVIIKGSEIVKGWEILSGTVWKVLIPNSFFGDYNPYKEKIHGDWFDDLGRTHHTGEVYLNGLSLFEVPILEQVLNPKPLERTLLKEQSLYTWYTEGNDDYTIIYANFHGVNPNDELVEINVRQACFYPANTGINYITVSGFIMKQAATNWAPPTAEQIGLIGTNWSKGWIIENNYISDSKCAGITLGKDRESGHNIWLKDPSISGAIHYNNLIDRILGEPFNWSKETVGSHIVRNNRIYNCEQAGICGSMGCAFSLIENNHISDIWVKRQFEGAEIAGIKFHGAIDAVIRQNRIHNCLKGIWLDWMTQGTRVTQNLLYDNLSEDIFVEVNHGPFVIDNNLILSDCVAILDGSAGGAYIHNFIKGKIIIVQQGRETPWLQPHSTKVFNRVITRNGDNRFYNNIFTSVRDSVTKQIKNHWWLNMGSFGLGTYNGYFPMYVNNNIYYANAQKYEGEKNFIYRPDFDPKVIIDDRGDEVYLHLELDNAVNRLKSHLITSDVLGRAKIPDLPYHDNYMKTLVFNVDYFGKIRNGESPSTGPFESPEKGFQVIRVW